MCLELLNLHIQTLTTNALFNFKTLGTHLMWVLDAYWDTVQENSQLWQGMWREPGLLSPHRWLTIQGKRLEYKLLHCFTPHGVKWKWDEFHRLAVFQVEAQCNSWEQDRGHSTRRISSTLIHNSSFVFFLNWKFGDLVFCVSLLLYRFSARP